MSDANTAPQPGATPAAARAPKRKRIMLIIASVFLIAGLAYTLYWLLFSRFYEETDNAYVQGNVVQVTSQVPGTIAKIHADDTDIVKSGQPLISLDTSDADVALSEAEAALAQTVREVRTLYASQAQAGANLNVRETDLKRAQDDLARRKALAGTGAVSGEEIQHAEQAVNSAKAAVAAAREQLASGKALTEGTTVAKHPNVQRAAAKVQEAMLAQSRATLYAPVAGEVAKRNAQLGQRIAPGSPLMAIVPLESLWVDANFKEGQLRHIRIGQPVELTADLYGGKVKYHGRVAGMAAGTGSAFAVLPAQNATGNWIKVVQRVPVRIALDPQQLREHPLRVGLSMNAEVDVHDQGGNVVADKSAQAGASAGAEAFANPIASAARARIDAIIAANLK